MVPFTQVATSDPVQITRWWQDALTGHCHEHNIGVLTDGLGLVDIDTKDNRPGLESFYALGGHFNTLTVRTPSGGFHGYFVPPQEVANAQWRDDAKEVLGLDIRGFHGYVLAPGSETPEGRYEIVVDQPLAALPAAILARCKAPGERTAAAAPAVDLDTPAALQAAATYAQQYPGAPQGDRSGSCYRLACQLKDRGVTEAVAADLVVEHWIGRCEPPMDHEEARATVSHAYQYGQNAEGGKSAAADFGAIVGLIEAPPPLAAPQRVEAPDAWAWGNLIPLALIPPRPWVIERRLMRGELSALIAPGGIGKSQLMLTTAILGAIGSATVFGMPNKVGRFKSLIYNAEDSRQEMSMRLFATCHQMQVDPAAVAPFITLLSGKEVRMKLVGASATGKPEIHKEIVKRLIDYTSDPECHYIGLDPLVSLHEIEEGLNTPMRYVFETFIMIAEQSQAALEIAVHTPKPGREGAYFYAGNADAGRGAVTLRDTARVVNTLSPPSDADMEKYDLAPEQRWRILRLDDAKLNYGLLTGKPAWLYKHTVHLANGEFVGAFTDYDLDSTLDETRQVLGLKIVGELHAEATAELSFIQLVARLCATDALYGQLPESMIRSRVERMIGNGIATPHGTVRMALLHGRKTIILE